MKKLITIAAAISCTAQVLFAQNETDILRYSQAYNFGTARSQGAGGAFGAVGADFSSTFINPAGIGLYRRNEANLSMGITATLANTKYAGTSMDDSRTGFNIPTFGVVFSKVYQDFGKDASKGIVSLNFAAGMNRIADFQQNISFSGINNRSSIADYYVQQANGIPVSQFRNDPGYASDMAFMGWNVYLIDSQPGQTTRYYSPYFADSSRSLRQGQQIEIRGGMQEYNFSGGMNIGDVFYFGASLIFTDVRHNYQSTFTETVLDPSNQYKTSKFTSEIKSSGMGVSGRFGVIVRPIEQLRFGFSAQTPSRINMRDDYNYNISANYASGNYSYASPANYIEYQVITPARYTASAALVLPSLGLLSADVEMVDYSQARLSANRFSFDNANAAAKSMYTQVYNVRVGAEVKTFDIFRIRGGFGMYGSPYKADQFDVKKEDLVRYVVSGGFGVLLNNVFLDFAVSNSFGKTYNTPYVLNDASKTYTAVNSYNTLNFALTGGIKF